ncbi:O-antigen ligase family protein [Microbacterium marinilacus]|uniref:O-antigen ligase-related domain-containing protein n=1 Tax=Microbacterium marinilacus TaxID=415209 RepID=A0ABP7BA62_9MICO|nr:O-antigen ligase family protein [Microbacterium marinilacus]MBY0687212.1 O-antigen ligase family protein [Microbacterium marinilacus]
MTASGDATPVRVLRLLQSAELARAFALAALATAFSAFAIGRMAGEATLVTIVAGLDALGIAILVARRDELTPLRFAPTSLLAFLAWTLASVVWSFDKTSTLAGWLGLVGWGLIALVIGHTRDALQTVRALGDVLRWMLALSLAVEILAGVLLDMPFPFLGIAGDLAHGGPVQGLFGTRNMLGFVAVMALVTFAIEWRTRSVPRGLSVFSLSLAGLLAVLSASPTVLVLAVAVLTATVALIVVRRAQPSRRRATQWTVGAVVAAVLGACYLLRHRIIRLLDAASDFSTRADLWNEILDWLRPRPVQGWGWHGTWHDGSGGGAPYPLNVINFVLDDRHLSALNAYFDVLIQVGWAGLLLFGGMCAVAMVRSWLVAGERRSVVHAWTPLMLVTLLVDSMFESFTLHGVGWLMLVVCAVRAGQSRSWRDRLRDMVDGGASQDPLAPTR